MNSYQRLQHRLRYEEQRGLELEHIIAHGHVPPVPVDGFVTDLNFGGCLSFNDVKEYLMRRATDGEEK